jgi:glycosyltransferase involved in cell wall biosynthesis
MIGTNLISGARTWARDPQDPQAGTTLMVSVVIPIYNEEGNIPILCERLFSVLNAYCKSFEVIAVNDGSRDGSLSALKEEVGRHAKLKIVDLRRNYGQTAGLMAGIDYASGDTIVMIDADLQNDPEDVPKILAKLDEGYDVVSGWRKDRKDAAFSRNFVSQLANRLISRISGVPLNDYGCTLKAYRKDVLKGMRLYGEMHRFIPIYASWMGAKIIEIPVRHYPRKFGKSNYGLERVGKILLDLVVVKFLDRYFVKPIYVFGGFGIFSIAIGALSTVVMIYLKLFEGISMISTPLPLLSAFTMLVGVMSILMGLLAEVMVRTYFESQQRPAYAVRQLFNFDNI